MITVKFGPKIFLAVITVYFECDAYDTSLLAGYKADCVIVLVKFLLMQQPKQVYYTPKLIMVAMP